jgi:hypothetical protein
MEDRGEMIMRKATVVLMMAALAAATCNVHDPFGDGGGAASTSMAYLVGRLVPQGAGLVEVL